MSGKHKHTNAMPRSTVMATHRLKWFSFCNKLHPLSHISGVWLNIYFCNMQRSTLHSAAASWDQVSFATLPPCQQTLITPGLPSHNFKKQQNVPPNTPEKTRFLKHSKPLNQMCSQRISRPANKGVTEQRMLWTVRITSQFYWAGQFTCIRFREVGWRALWVEIY